MRVLGIVPSSTDLKWIFLEGTREQPRILPLPIQRHKLPLDECEGHSLLSLRRFLTTFFQEQKVEKIFVLQGGNFKGKGPSSARVKAEAVIQIVGAEMNIELRLIAPQTLNAEERKFPQVTSGTPEQILNEGDSFRPKDLREVSILAWAGLVS